jgi:hypothetical protein
MSRSEKRLSRWLKATGLLYAAGAIDFTVRPRAATDSLGRATGDAMAPEPPGVYNALASAYMATIAALALAAARNPRLARPLVPPLLVAKATSSAGFLLRYVRTRKLGFAAGAALDAFLLGVTAGLYGALDD